MGNAPVHLGDLVDWAITRQSRAGFLLFLAVGLGTATGLFIALFQVTAWKEALLIWAWEQEQASVIRAVVEGRWMLEWKQWAAIGIGTTILLVASWYFLNRSVARKMQAVPGLRAAVRTERQERTAQSFVLVGCLLALVLLPFAIAWGASHEQDWDDD